MEYSKSTREKKKTDKATSKEVLANPNTWLQVKTEKKISCF